MHRLQCVRGSYLLCYTRYIVCMNINIVTNFVQPTSCRMLRNIYIYTIWKIRNTIIKVYNNTYCVYCCRPISIILDASLHVLLGINTYIYLCGRISRGVTQTGVVFFSTFLPRCLPFHFYREETERVHHAGGGGWVGAQPPPFPSSTVVLLVVVEVHCFLSLTISFVFVWYDKKSQVGRVTSPRFELIVYT